MGVYVKRDTLIFSFPELPRGTELEVDFQRTLRIPDDGLEYSLPPGLGRFPLGRVKDLGTSAPESWRARGGIFLPMYQAEAMWLNFRTFYPFAVQVSAGGVNAITGSPAAETLGSKPQDYLVTPDQPWLDGFCVRKGVIRQFVAMPLGQGYSAEEQITHEANVGGLQLTVRPMKASWYRDHRSTVDRDDDIRACCCESIQMGLAPGGTMRQEVYEDPYGMDAWDEATERCHVHIVNSMTYCSLTGRPPSFPPPTAAAYTDAGLPWFEYFDAELTALQASPILAALNSVATLGASRGEQPLPENQGFPPPRPIGLRRLRVH